jgi:hypothetical protein
MSLVSENTYLYLVATDMHYQDPWVKENVIPILSSIPENMTPTFCKTNEFGTKIRAFVGKDNTLEIISDSPVDIGRFCHVYMTDENGDHISSDIDHMRFTVYKGKSYPTDLEGMVQHNALCDALALMYRLTKMRQL